MSYRPAIELRIDGACPGGVPGSGLARSRTTSTRSYYAPDPAFRSRCEVHYRNAVTYVAPMRVDYDRRLKSLLRTALRPSGRLAFACWRKFDENPWPCAPRLNTFHRCRGQAPKIPGPLLALPENRVCAAFLRTPGFARLYTSGATSIST